jgi:hypothetical protein
LESVCGGNSTVGSNPTLSVKCFLESIRLGKLGRFAQLFTPLYFLSFKIRNQQVVSSNLTCGPQKLNPILVTILTPQSPAVGIHGEGLRV